MTSLHFTFLNIPFYIEIYFESCWMSFCLKAEKDTLGLGDNKVQLLSLSCLVFFYSNVFFSLQPNCKFSLGKIHGT